MISWFLLVPVLVPGLVSLVFFFLGNGIVLHHDLLVPSGSGSGPGRGLSPYFSFLSFLRKGILFHHDFLVPSGSGSGSGACLPTFLSFLFSGKGPCSIMISWFLLVLAQVPGLLSLLSSPFF